MQLRHEQGATTINRISADDQYQCMHGALWQTFKHSSSPRINTACDGASGDGAMARM